jgi:hypothetical protein
MTELEKLERARMYLDKLANGIDTITDSELPSDSALNNVRLSRCFFYVSDILRQVIENGGNSKPVKRAQKEDFKLTDTQKANIDVSATPLTISNFTKLINAVVDENVMKILPATAVTGWLMSVGLLMEIQDALVKKKKVPTDSGRSIGLTLEKRQSLRGDYEVVLYHESAQHFVIDHLEAIADHYKNKPNASDAPEDS